MTAPILACVGLFVGTNLGFLACAVMSIGPRRDAERSAYLRGLERGYEAALAMEETARVMAPLIDAESVS